MVAGRDIFFDPRGGLYRIGRWITGVQVNESSVKVFQYEDSSQLPWAVSSYVGPSLARTFFEILDSTKLSDGRLNQQAFEYEQFRIVKAGCDCSGAVSTTLHDGSRPKIGQDEGFSDGSMTNDGGITEVPPDGGKEDVSHDAATMDFGSPDSEVEEECPLGFPSEVIVSGTSSIGAMSLNASGNYIAYTMSSGGGGHEVTLLNRETDEEILIGENWIFNSYAMSGDATRIALRTGGDYAEINLETGEVDIQPAPGTPDLVISRNGECLAYRKWSRDKGADLIYLYDIPNEEEILVSSGYGGSLPNSSIIPRPYGVMALSGDCSTVVYMSEASNHVEEDTNGLADLFKFDVVSRENERINLDDIRYGYPVPCPDSAWYCWQYDIIIGALSYSGQQLSFSFATNMLEPPMMRAYVYDWDAPEDSRLELISVTPGGEPTGGSVDDISDDGNRVLIESGLSDLVDEEVPDPPSWPGGDINLFLRDRERGQTVLINGDEEELIGPTELLFYHSLGGDGGWYYGPALSGDGSTVAYRVGYFPLDPGSSDQSRALIVKSALRALECD